MLFRGLIATLVACVVAAPAAGADRTVLMPNVIYERQVQFTRHGPVAVHVITAPRPGGPYELRPALSNGIIPGLERLTLMQQRAAGSAKVAGVSGDASLRGAFLQGGVLAQLPDPERATISVDAQGNLRVERISVFSNWSGTGPRRASLALNRAPGPNGMALFTPAWGPSTPPGRNALEATLTSFPAATLNTELSGTSTELVQGGGRPIPPDGAVLRAHGSSAQLLQAEAAPGTLVTVRLQSAAWIGAVHAVGGGPLLVKSGRPVFRTQEEFSTTELALSQPRTAIGQRADGRLVLVAVDGRQPGYSTGLTNYELARTMARLGAVTAAGLTIGPTASMAFDGRLLSRPAGGERAVADGLLVAYSGQRRGSRQGNP